MRVMSHIAPIAIIIAIAIWIGIGINCFAMFINSPSDNISALSIVHASFVMFMIGSIYSFSSYVYILVVCDDEVYCSAVFVFLFGPLA